MNENNTFLLDCITGKSAEYRLGVIQGILALMQFEGLILGGDEWELLRLDLEEWEGKEWEADIRTLITVAIHLPYALAEWRNTHDQAMKDTFLEPLKSMLRDDEP